MENIYFKRALLKARLFSLPLFIVSIVCIFNVSYLNAQIVNTTTTPYNYGTGDATTNAGYPTTLGGGTATIVYSGNDVTVTGSGTIVTGATTTSGIFNFRHFTINAGVTLTISGSSPLVIRCTGTAYIAGTLTAAGSQGQDVSANVGGTGGVSNNGGGVNGGAGIASGQNGNIGFSGVSYLGNTTGKGGGGASGGSGGYGGSGGGYGTAGGNGPTVTTGGTVYGDAGLTTLNTGGTTNLLGGSGGGGGGARTSATLRAGAGGGSGGGALCITANSIIIASTGIVTVKGGKGGNMSDSNSSAGGGGGGGSGGTLLFQYLTQLTGVTSVPGGAGVPNVNVSAAAGSFTVDISGGLKGIFYIGGDGGQGRYLAQQDVQCTAPTQASSFSNPSSTATSADLSWTRGNGDNVLVIGRYGSAPTIDPNIGFSYSDNSTFGLGQEVGYTGSGQFVLYNGPLTGVTVNGLQPGGTYYFAVYEYFNSGYCYKRPALTGSATTTTACFRTISSGNWSNPSIWEMQTSCSGGWSAALVAPDYAASSILLQTGYDISVTANVTIDETVMQTGSSLTVNSGVTLTLNNGAGTDLDVTGATVTQTGTITQNASATVNFNSGSTYIHNRDAGAIPIATWASNTNCNVTGILGTAPTNMGQTFYNFLWNCTSQTGFLSLNSFPTGMNGTCEFRQCGASNTQQINWTTGGTFTWAGDFITSCRNIMLTSGGSSLNFTCRDVNINSNYGGTPRLLTNNSTNAVTFNLRNLTISGSSIDFNGINTNNTTINISGNLTMTGGSILNSSNSIAGTAALIFNGTSQQNINLSGSYSITSVGNLRTIAFTAANGSIVNFQTALTCGSAATPQYVSFTAANGSTLIIPDVNGIVNTAGTTIGSVRMPATGGVATFNTGASYTFSGSATQVTGVGLPATVNNLSFTNPVGVTCPTETVSGNLTLTNAVVTLSGNVSVTGNTTMTGSLLTLGNNNLTLTGSLNGSFSVSNMIITNGAGALIKTFTAAAPAFTFPVGENTGATEYSPVTLTLNSTSISRNIGARVIDGIHPSSGPQTHYLSRYWPMSVTGTGTYNYNILFEYNSASGDINGTESSIQANRWSGTTWTEYGSTASSGTLTVTSVLDQSTGSLSGTFTGRVNYSPGTGCYRTVGSGSWYTPSVWETDPNCDGNWVAATYPPDYNASVITIRNGHTVSVDGDVMIDQTIVETSGTLSSASASTVTVNDGTGIDLDVNGAVNTTSSGTLTVSAGALCNFNTGSNYNHQRDGGAVPSAYWGNNSNCNITGILGTIPTNLNQTFYNFLWNCVGQTGGVYHEPEPTVR